MLNLLSYHQSMHATTSHLRRHNSKELNILAAFPRYEQSSPMLNDLSCRFMLGKNCVIIVHKRLFKVLESCCANRRIHTVMYMQVFNCMCKELHWLSSQSHTEFQIIVLIHNCSSCCTRLLCISRYLARDLFAAQW